MSTKLNAVVFVVAIGEPSGLNKNELEKALLQWF
jgi:hypothetical protein